MQLTFIEYFAECSCLCTLHVTYHKTSINFIAFAFYNTLGAENLASCVRQTHAVEILKQIFINYAVR